MRKIFVAIAAFAALSLAQEAGVAPAAGNVTIAEAAPAQTESVALNSTEAAPVIPAENVEAAPAAETVETTETAAPVAAESSEESAQNAVIPTVIAAPIAEAVEEAAALGDDIENAVNESYTLGGSINDQSENVQVSLGQIEINSAQHVMVPTVLVAVAGFALLH